MAKQLRLTTDDEEEAALNSAMPDPEYPEEALPPMNVCADELT